MAEQQNMIFVHGGAVTSLKVVGGQHVTVAAADAIAIAGFTRIVAAVVSMIDDPGDDPVDTTCAYSGATLTIKSWKNISGTDPTPAPATTFGKRVDFLVMGF